MLCSPGGHDERHTLFDEHVHPKIAASRIFECTGLNLVEQMKVPDQMEVH